MIHKLLLRGHHHAAHGYSAGVFVCSVVLSARRFHITVNTVLLNIQTVEAMCYDYLEEKFHLP